MLDPGALGTLLIGLDHVRRENSWTEQPAPQPPRRYREWNLARRVAGGLRWLADAVEPARLPADVAADC